MKQETNIQNDIRIALAERGHFTFRYNVGKFYTMDGRMISIGEKGVSDLIGHRSPDAKAIYLETKTPIGKASKEQKAFIAAMKNSGAIAGFVRSVEDAIKLVEEK